ncbi:hypothetical protein QTN47_11175 [Danxiaibacter flavus]|uniref:Uncharacterized protein n=1 Tax=Danxiaibacter flavus TaxID=3049108 RepID=A0ABV3ZEV7_9BACT|nr:hypothetical protein QNM32_11180 [Chitinophagaceae bacterium DXS]
MKRIISRLLTCFIVTRNATGKRKGNGDHWPGIFMLIPIPVEVSKGHVTPGGFLIRGLIFLF